MDVTLARVIRNFVFAGLATLPFLAAAHSDDSDIRHAYWWQQHYGDHHQYNRIYRHRDRHPRHQRDHDHDRHRKPRPRREEAVGLELTRGDDVATIIELSVGVPSVELTRAVGVDGGRGDDQLTIVGLSVTAPAINAMDGIGTVAHSEVVGVDGGPGNDKIVNTDTLEVVASATLSDTTVFLSDDVDIEAVAEAIGIAGGSGDDTITNPGTIDVDATADTSATTVQLVSSLGGGEITTRSEADATGIDGGSGDDTITNSGNNTLDVTATATTSGTAVEFNLLAFGEQDVSTEASATAVGIDGGDDDDTLLNSGTLNATASAQASQTQISIEAINAQSVTTDIAVEADATGMVGNDGDDTITNTGTINSSAEVSLLDFSFTATLLQFVGNSATRMLQAVATGIDGGDDDDVIVNLDTIDVTATSTINVVGLSVNLFDATIVTADFGDVEPITDYGTVSGAQAIGIRGDDGDDSIDNAGTLTATANANFTGVAVGVTGEGVSAGLVNLVNGRPLSEIGTNASAVARGVLGDDDDDTLTNTGTLTVSADADAVDVNASVGLFDFAAQALGTTLPSFSTLSAGTSADATASGMDGGDDDDVLINLGEITVDADAIAIAVAFNLALDISDDASPLTLVDVDGLAVDARTVASATAGGLLSGQILNAGTLSTRAAADADSVAAALNLGIDNSTPDGDDGISIALDVSLIDSSTIVSTEATGLAGDTILLNTGTATTVADANANAVAVQVGINPSIGPGVEISADMVRAATDVSAAAYGMLGSDGDDLLNNEGTLTTTAEASTVGVAVSASFAGQVQQAFSVEAALADVSSIVSADAYGMLGEDDDDTLLNTGALTTTADANAVTTSVGLQFGTGMQSLLLGIAGARATTEAHNHATGIDGGDDDDTIVNTGPSSVLSDADATAVSVGIVIENVTTGGALAGALTDASTITEAGSVGFAGGDDDDIISNQGTLDVTANADANSAAVSIGVAVASQSGFAGGASLARAETTATANAVGIDGGDDEDQLANLSDLTVTADAHAGSGSGALGVQVAVTGVALGASLTDVGADSFAYAFGLVGGDDDDIIGNDGVLTVGSIADTLAVSVSAQIGVTTQAGVAGGAALARAGGTATATAAGINGGDDDDVIGNTGTVDVDADARSDSVSIGISGNFATTGLAVGVSLVDSSNTATATAVGLSGGDDDDQILNDITGNVDVDAIAFGNADSITLGLGVTGQAGLGVGVALGRTDNTVTATAIGIDGGEDDDVITNAGTVDVLADADAVSVGVGISGSGTTTGVGLGAALIDTQTQATATGVGIATSEGEDVIQNLGSVTTIVDANALSVGVTLQIGAVIQGGLSAGGALARAGTNATANATGVALGEGVINNQGSLTTRATATANADTVSVSGNGTIAGVALGGSFVDGSSNATANASAITGGEFADVLSNNQIMDTSATADANTVGVSVQAAGTIEGVAGGAALGRGDSVGTATSTGLVGNGGNDLLTNAGTLTSTALADTDSNSVGVQIAVAGGGLAGGASLIDGGSTANATALGMTGNDGADQILNTRSSTANATANSNTNSIAVAIQGVPKGVTLGAALTDASSTADADATTLDGGAGGDVIQSLGAVNASALADADSVGVSTEIGLTVVGGVSGGASLSRTTTEAYADALGINGGFGSDLLISDGPVNVLSDADALSVSVSLTFNLAVGVSLSAALTDASTIADSYALGISGGQGLDRIFSTGRIDTTATASAIAPSIATTIGISFVPGAAALATAGSDATAYAGGIDGGLHDDLINSASEIHSMADATAGGPSIAVNFGAGAALGDANAEAMATALGITGGWGDDTVLSTGTIESISTATATGVNVTATLIGAALGHVDSDADAIATGISGDLGSDVLFSGADITTMATANAPAVNVNVNFTGATLGDTETTVNAFANGMDGGDGDDTISNVAAIGATADASTTIVSVNTILNFLGAVLSDFSTTADARASGLTGGMGDDLLINQGPITATATADADSVDVMFSLLGAGLGDGSVNSVASAFGMDGGDGNDQLFNDALITTSATATGGATGVGVTLVGAQLSDLSTEATAASIGLNGAAGVDLLANNADVIATATADLGAVSVSVAPVGAALSDSSVTASAAALGMDGGSEADQLLNTAALTSTATATTDGTSVNVTLAGDSDGDVRTDATAVAGGMAGGSENDAIDNQGAITATATGDADASTVGVNLLGAALSDADTEGVATAFGIDAGSGDDIILNSGSITNTATGTSHSGAVNVNIAGAAIGDIGTRSVGHASGIAGGDGDDTIEHSGSIVSTANANASSNNTSVAILGAAIGSGGTNALALANGIDGGTGSDAINSSGTIRAIASATADANDYSFSLAGLASGGGDLAADSFATGISAGDGDDTVASQARIDSNSTVIMNLSSGSFSFAGFSESDGAMRGVADAAGIAGGQGSDTLNNLAELIVGSDSTLTTSGSMNVAFGAASAGARLTATSTAAGMSGGGGADLLSNLSLIDVDTSSSLTLGRSSFTFAGAGDSSGALTGRSSALGLAGDGGIDELFNVGTMLVTARSTLTADNNADVAFGAAGAGSNSSGEANAGGLDGGTEDDALRTDGTLDVDAIVTMTLRSSNFTFAGAGDADGSLVGRANAFGLGGSEGNDWLGNFGNSTIDARSTLTANSNTDAAFGAAGAGAQIRAESTAVGMTGGLDDDILLNGALLDVNSNASASATGTSYVFGGGSSTSTSLNAIARATGIAGDDGLDTITNDSVIDVLARAATSSSGAARATFGATQAEAVSAATSVATGIDGGADADGVTNDGIVIALANPTANVNNNATAGALFSNSRTRSRARIGSLADGTALGDGANAYGGTGDMSARAIGSATTRADSNPGAVSLSVNAFATAISEANSVRATGIAGGHGDNAVSTGGALVVTASPTASADANAQGAGVADGDGTGSATANANNARATGIGLGNGNNFVANDGSMSVTASPTATAAADGFAGTGIAGADGRATATSRANNATAIGISVGHGANIVVNGGTISALSDPQANSTARAEGHSLAPLAVIDLIKGNATATANLHAQNAVAIGVNAGDGGNHIVNTGTISASSTPGTSATTSATVDTFTITVPAPTLDDPLRTIDITFDGGDKTRTSTPSNERTTGRRAIGIQTGSGADVVEQFGSVTATEAIVTGAGADHLILGDASTTTGSINLGSGDDTLQLTGTPIVNGTINNGGGVDTLLLDGPGSFNNPLSGFELARKQGLGTYAVGNLPSMQRINITGGVLQVNSSYAMGPGSVFETMVYGDGSFGQLSVTGTAAVDGDLSVLKGAGPYLDGTLYDVISAASVAGAFAAETLPSPTALVDFSVNTLPAAVQVEANVASFTSVVPADQHVALAIAEYLDGVLPTASGEIAGLLDQLQNFTDADFDGIFNSMGPDSLDDHVRTTLSNLRRVIRLPQRRMRHLRASSIVAGEESPFIDGGTSGFSKHGLLPSLGQPYGAWSATFDHSGLQAAGNAGFDNFGYYTTGRAGGIDYLLNEQMAVGVSFASTYSEVSAGLDGGTLEGQMSSIYGSWFAESGTYMESLLSFGRNNFDAARAMHRQISRDIANSNHDAKVLSSFNEIGHAFGLGSWRSEVFGALHYTNIDEEAFQESGAFGLNWIVDERTTEALTLELGWRGAPPARQIGSGELKAQITAAFLHDVEIGDNRFHARLAGAPGHVLRLQGRERSGDGVRFGGEISFLSDRNWDLSANLDAELRSDHSDLGALIQYSRRF